MFIKKTFLFLGLFLLISSGLFSMRSDEDLEREKNEDLSRKPLKLSPSKYFPSRSFESPEEENNFLRAMIYKKKYVWLSDDQREELLKILNKDGWEIFKESPYDYSKRVLKSSGLTYFDFVQGRRMVLFSNELYQFEIHK